MTSVQKGQLQVQDHHKIVLYAYFIIIAAMDVGSFVSRGGGNSGLFQGQPKGFFPWKGQKW